MNSILIPIHSFVDLITNSSTEIYVSAHKETVAAIRKIVDALLLAGGDAHTADELFDFALEVKDPDSYPAKHYPVDSAEGKRILEEYADDNYDRGPKQHVRVTAKTDSPSLKEAAKTLSNLSGLFEIDAWRDG
jgi:hypothetical protein